MLNTSILSELSLLLYHLKLAFAEHKPAKYTHPKLQHITKRKEPNYVSGSIVDSQKVNESEQAEWGDRQDDWVVRAAPSIQTNPEA